MFIVKPLGDNVNDCSRYQIMEIEKKSDLEGNLISMPSVSSTATISELEIMIKEEQTKVEKASAKINDLQEKLAQIRSLHQSRLDALAQAKAPEAVEGSAQLGE